MIDGVKELTQAKRFEDLGIDTGSTVIGIFPMADQFTRPMVKPVKLPSEDDAA